MLSRIELNGFKTFEDFGLDLMPLCVITGPNAVGKSNLFDALRLLSRLVSLPDLAQAFSALRGRPGEQFRSVPGSEPANRIEFAVECLLDPSIEDAFGNRFELSNTRLRYELTVERRFDDAMGVERLYVIHETARALTKQNDRWMKHIRGKIRLLDNRDRYRPRKNAFLATKSSQDGRTLITAQQDGVQGRPRPLPADRATATYLSTVNDAKDFGHLYALKRALSDIMFLQADPVAERKASDHHAPPDLEPNAGNLAAVLHRISVQTRGPDRPQGALADISTDLASLVPGVIRIDVESNEKAREFEVFARLRDGHAFNSRVLSDGTLRLLALVTVANDPRRPGTLCFEEPENGVSEARVEHLIRLLRDACEDPGEKLFQVLMNSHSPRVQSALADGEAIVADMESISTAGSPMRRRSRMRLVSRKFLLPPELMVSEVEARELLDSPDPVGA
jgi:predicted ATPase